jgi:hypothetical protein
MSKLVPPVLVALTLLACDAPKETAAPASAAPEAITAAPSEAPPAPTVAAKKPSHPCPEGSEGEGTQKDPCLAKGVARIMEAVWSGKTTDKGPQFRVTSKSTLEILFGNIIVYFYDAAGKQLDVAQDDKPQPHLSCSGNIFAGAVKPGEKITLWFSCVKKEHVPAGTAAIEAELRTVGFTDDSGKRSDTFWRNDDLVPSKRPKGGVK